MLDKDTEIAALRAEVTALQEQVKQMLSGGGVLALLMLDNEDFKESLETLITDATEAAVEYHNRNDDHLDTDSVFEIAREAVSSSNRVVSPAYVREAINEHDNDNPHPDEDDIERIAERVLEEKIDELFDERYRVMADDVMKRVDARMQKWLQREVA